MTARCAQVLGAAIRAKHALEAAEPGKWAETFVSLKMAFFHDYADGLVCSIAHGVDYFDNIIAACEGRLVWKEKGEYGDNFRKLTGSNVKIPWA
jgi:hypothetical protein